MHLRCTNDSTILHNQAEGIAKRNGATRQSIVNVCIREVMGVDLNVCGESACVQTRIVLATQKEVR